MNATEDVPRYQGQAFSYIGFDELTQHPTPFAWDYMRSRLRTDPDLPIFMRATTNPEARAIRGLSKCLSTRAQQMKHSMLGIWRDG